jgi:hypothetical protein
MKKQLKIKLLFSIPFIAVLLLVVSCELLSGSKTLNTKEVTLIIEKKEIDTR